MKTKAYFYAICVLAILYAYGNKKNIKLDEKLNHKQHINFNANERN